MRPYTYSAMTQTRDHVERIAREAFADFAHGLATGEWDAWLARLADDFVFYFPQGQFAGRNEGLGRAAEFFQYVRTVYPEGLFATLDGVTSNETTAVFEFRDEGLMRLPTGDRDYRNRVAVALDVRGDEITGYREYFGGDGTWNE